jgi:hypothetical protein
LCYKQINDLYICNEDFGRKYCIARNDNENNIYYYDIKDLVMKEKIFDICCGFNYLILLTQSGSEILILL